MPNKPSLNLIFHSVVFLSLIFSAALFAQDESLTDSLVTGKRYTVTLYNEKEIIGKVVKQDSLYVFMVSESGTAKIKKEDIFTISKNAVPKLLKVLLTLGAGAVFQSGYNDYSNRDDKPGYSFQLTALTPFSENKAIRLELGFSSLKRERYYYQYYESYNETSEQTRKLYSAKVDFLFGDFSTKSDFHMYGLAGTGVLFTRENDYSYTYYSSYDSTYRTDIYRGYNSSVFMFAVGGGIQVKIKNRIGLYLEAQYNVVSTESYFLFFGNGYFPIRAGFTYSLY